MFTLVMFVSETVIDSNTRQSRDCTCLGHLGRYNTDRIIYIYVVLPKVAKESTTQVILKSFSEEKPFKHKKL